MFMSRAGAFRFKSPFWYVLTVQLFPTRAFGSATLSMSAPGPAAALRVVLRGAIAVFERWRRRGQSRDLYW